ncbi:hypothetical protein [Prevotella sp. P6B1]|uniref:hypothetical protein n=1 Tax=Prevotella sp. P6B1 TaxID=1410613 RepID=UPI0012DCFF9E|nr:hypothetical protein [Prevotella sp. P6B1]
MSKDYRSMLPSGDSQIQGGNSETGGRQESPRKQEKPHTILQVVNKLKELFCGGHKRATLYDQKEYERGVKAVMKGKFLVKSTHEAIEMLIDQQTLLGSIPLDAMRNNSSKLVNQDMDVVPLEEMNLYAGCILRQVAENMHDSKLMSRYVEELTKKDREKWQQSQVCMAMMKGGETVCEYIEANAEEHLIRLSSRMEWFPIAYHLADKVALIVFPVLAYYTGKYHLNDTMTFLWAMAFMPIFVLSAIWAINELAAYLERRKKKPKSRR